MANDARNELLNLIDKKAFDVIINTDSEKFKGKDKETFEGILKKTKNEKKKFHQDYQSADEVKENFLQNVHSEAAKKLNKERLEKFAREKYLMKKDNEDVFVIIPENRDEQ